MRQKMQTNTSFKPPSRITDIVELKQAGAMVVCQPSFEIVQANFEHQRHPFQAHIFLCRYTGTVNSRDYFFRKCYARGCPHNLCPQVSQAVMIANRYLQRDLRLLRKNGIEVESRLFSLDDMVVKFEDLHAEKDPILTIYDYIHIAEEGNNVAVEMALEFIPAVEHFATHKNAQTFLTAKFAVETLGSRQHCERFFACFPTAQGAEEMQRAVEVANARLAQLYGQFDRVSIKYEKRFFEPG
jgi:hypothetical protein